MRRRLKLRTPKEILIKKILIIFLVINSLPCFILWFANKQLLPLLLNYSQVEIEKIINIAINNSTKQEYINKLDSNSLFDISQNNNGDIRYINYNSIIVNEFLDKITNNIQEDLVRVSNGDMSTINGYKSYSNGIVYRISLGVLTNNMLLSNIGPEIPIKLKLVGYINSNVNVSVKEYGINNAIVELYVKVDVKARVVLPFASQEVLVTNMIPISFKIIQGTVPEYYQNGISSNSNLFSLPMK